MSDAKPRPKPCASCPYRCDVPSGIWDESEYIKLPAYDEPTHMQPMQVFMCHQADGTVCAGWASVHGNRDNLALRLAASLGARIDRDAVIAYQSPVPLFSSGTEAAAHGLADLAEPGIEARLLVEKLTAMQRRKGMTDDSAADEPGTTGAGPDQ